jgi:glycogen synthase
VHILVTTDTVGGVWTYTRELTYGLLARGHRVTLVSFGKLPSHRQTLWLNHKNLTYHCTEFPLEWMQNAQGKIEASIEYLADAIQNARPDVLHFNQFCYGALDCGIPKVVVAHSDVLSWWGAVHGEDAPRSSWIDWYTAVVSRGLSAADAVVAPSHWMLGTLQTFYKLPGRCSVIYNGRTEGLFSPSAPKSDAVLSVGRIWDEGKQIRLLLERNHNVPVRIAGSVHQPGKPASDSWTPQPTSSFQFCGEQDEEQLRELYADSATYAATSRYEPFGLAPVEAAFSRCALVVNDIPVFHELWGDAAFYFDRNNSESLAQAIRLLSECASLRELLADSAYEHARQRFGSARMVAEYESLYRSLTGKSEDA